MLVDITFFVQILNFLAAYQIFTRIFVKPAYTLVRAQQSTMEQLIACVELQELSTTQRTLALNRELADLQHDVLNDLPADGSRQETLSTHPIEACAHEAQTVPHNQLADALAEQVIHDISR